MVTKLLNMVGIFYKGFSDINTFGKCACSENNTDMSNMELQIPFRTFLDRRVRVHLEGLCSVRSHSHRCLSRKVDVVYAPMFKVLHHEISLRPWNFHCI